MDRRKFQQMKNRNEIHKTSFHILDNLKYLMAAVFIAGSTGIGYLFRHLGFPETNIVIVYLLAILLISRLSSGYLIGIISSIVGTLAYNYCFAEPYFSFSVYDPSYMITFGVMTITSFIVSTLTSRERQNALESQMRESEAQALYTLTKSLTSITDFDHIIDTSVTCISDCFHCNATYAPLSEKDQSSSDSDNEPFKKESKFWSWPIRGQKKIFGHLLIPATTAEFMKESQRFLLQTMIESIALAMERFLAASQQLKAREEAAQERYRANLLRAISHDLRTPLSGIMGNCEVLMKLTEADKELFSMIQGIYQDADWLHSLVENILNLTKLQDGKLTLSKEPEALEEIVGGAVFHISKHYPEYEIQVNIPPQLLLVPMDGKLIEQVLINLLDNAIKHSPLNKEITLSVTLDSNHTFCTFTITDCGEGILTENMDHIFQAFYTSEKKRSDAQRGIGLGLTICEAIVSAHHGKIWAANRADQTGAQFFFTLPLEDN